MSGVLDFLSYLPVETLESLLSKQSSSDTHLPMDERDSQAELMAQKRAKQRDIVIPPPRNMKRRLASLDNVELFLTTYFPNVFYEPFTADRRAMMNDIVDAAQYGGDQAIAGPRGEGKTRLALYVALYLMVSGKSVFPIVIGKSQTKAQSELKTIKEKLQQTALFIADFPEIGVPFKKVGGWSSRGRMQTFRQENTNIEIAADHLIFPTIEGLDWESRARGQIIASMGVDGPIRGTNYRDVRPTIAIIDDIESRESANSDTLIEKNEEIIEQDIGGLGASSERISRVMLCTTLNRKCIAFRYTDPKQKPSWRGKRYRKMVKRPDRMDLVQQYIEHRQLRRPDDPDAREAFRYWRDNQAEIERGCIVSNPYSYSRKLHSDGEPLELSAIHAYFNRVADVGETAVATEIDNDPPEESGPQGLGLTAEIVAGRISGLARRQLPANAEFITAGIDIGKYNCHWAVCAWWRGAGGCVIDYGVAEVVGNENVRHDDRAADIEASEPAIYRALLAWRDYILTAGYTDAAGATRKVDMVLVDSGAYTNSAYEFCRQVKGVFRPSKGIAGYRRRDKSSATCIAGTNQHAQWLPSQGVWLHELHTDYWKQWVHERFLTPNFDENNLLRRG